MLFSRFKLLLLCLSMCLLVSACTSIPASVSSALLAGKTVVAVPTLRELAQERHFFVGTAVNVDALQSDASYATVLGREFNMVTPENAMKFDATNPRQGVFTFQQGDTLVAFAHAHGMQVRGHNLVWYRALPSWVADRSFTRNELLAIMKEHIQAVVGHYRSQVNIWDVVNEAVNDTGTLRASIWEKDIGADYIDWAFRWAHEANPQAHLFYNDYGAEGLGVKSDAVYTLVKGMVQRGVPIYGVGLQMHTSVVSPPVLNDIMANIRRLAALGLKVQITEMDVQLQHDPRPLAERLQAQAKLYHDVLSLCLSLSVCEAFVMWGFTDRYTWIPAATGKPDEPLIFDSEYRRKLAYGALISAFG